MSGFIISTLFLYSHSKRLISIKINFLCLTSQMQQSPNSTSIITDPSSPVNSVWSRNNVRSVESDVFCVVSGMLCIAFCVIHPPPESGTSTFR